MIVLAVILALAVFVWVVARPAVGAYLFLFANPLIVGVARGDLLPAVRPNELLLLMIVAAMGVRMLLDMLAGRYRPTPVNRIDLALILLAFTSSVMPMIWRYIRDLPVTADDVLYAIVLWKYFILYRVFRGSVRTPRQVAWCLWICMFSAAMVAVVGMLQVGSLLGVPELLHAFYDQPFEGHKGLMTERGTSTVGSAFGFADLMIMNVVLALALTRGLGRRDWPLLALAGLFLGGCIAAGEFSGYIGTVVAVVVYGLLSGRLLRLMSLGVPVVMAGMVVFWHVIETRLADFEHPSGMPHSWNGRVENLQNFFLPELAKGINWLFGVRPAPRLPASETWREYVYIESGYIWLVWIGGLPLLAAFFYFVWVAAKDLRRVARERAAEPIGAAAASGFAYVFVLLTLMLFDPHLTVRGSADLFFPLLALAFVRGRVEAPARAGLATATGPVRVPIRGPEGAFSSKMADWTTTWPDAGRRGRGPTVWRNG